MKVKELIKILNQFDPEKRVLIQAGESVLRPANVQPLAPGEYRSYATKAEFGDIIMDAVSH